MSLHNRKYKVPATMPRKPMALASIITELKFLPRRKAILAGKTMIVDTKSAPAAGIIRAIATPVTMLKRIDMVRTGRPSTKAVSSSKVRIYMGLKRGGQDKQPLQ